MRKLKIIFALFLVMFLTIDAEGLDRRRKIVTGCQQNQGLNKISSLILWYEGDNALVDGGNYAYEIPDLSRSHNNATQSNATFRPYRYDALGGFGPTYFNILYFDGTDDRLSFSPINNIGSSFAIAWSSSVSSYVTQRPILGYTGGAFNTIQQISATTTGIIYNNGLSFTFTHLPTNDGNMHHNILTSDGEHYLDGILSVRAGLQGTGLSLDLLGATGAVTYAEGIIDDVAVFTSPLSKADKNFVGNFLASRNAGATWTNIP